MNFLRYIETFSSNCMKEKLEENYKELYYFQIQEGNTSQYLHKQVRIFMNEKGQIMYSPQLQLSKVNSENMLGRRQTSADQTGPKTFYYSLYSISDDYMIRPVTHFFFSISLIVSSTMLPFLDICCVIPLDLLFRIRKYLVIQYRKQLTQACPILSLFTCIIVYVFRALRSTPDMHCPTLQNVTFW